MDDEVLAGGVANPGAVIRTGDTVSRPAPRNAESIHRLLDHLAEAGFESPRPVAKVAGGRETLGFVRGDVPIPPYPAWALTGGALESVARLLRRYHDAVATFPFTDSGWSTELRDPKGGELVCHNDVCLENVVFRDGRAVALLDFDLAAPGRRVWDVATAAKMCVPLRPPDDLLPGQGSFDPLRRLATFARAYGVRPEQSGELVDAIEEVMLTGKAFVDRHLAAGHEGFSGLVAAQRPGAFERRLEWWREIRGSAARLLEESL